MGTKVVIFGSRSFCTLPKKTNSPYERSEYDQQKLKKAFEFLDRLLQGKDVEIVCGLAHGADMVGYYYAIHRNLPLWQFPADWLQYKTKAGMVRNAQMREVGDEFIGFWDLESRGTAEMRAGVLKTNKPLKMFGMNFEPLG